MSNEQVTHSDMRLFVEAVVKPNPLLPRTQLKDLKIPKNFKPFVKSLSALVVKKANTGTSNAFQITQAGIKKDKGIPVYLYSIGLTSMEGKVNLLAYKWAPNDLIFKYVVEFREVEPKEIPGVWFRLALAQTAANQHDPPPLSQYIQCLMEAGLEESDIIGDFSMGSKPDVEGFSVSKVFEPFLYFKLKPEACEGHGCDEHVIFTGEDGVVTRLPFSIASNCDNGQAEEKANQTHPSNSLRGRRQEGVGGRGREGQEVGQRHPAVSQQVGRPR